MVEVRAGGAVKAALKVVVEVRAVSVGQVCFAVLKPTESGGGEGPQCRSCLFGSRELEGEF